jgi:hypothetical protein
MQTDNAISKFIKKTCFTGYYIIFRSMGKMFFYRVFEASFQERFRDFPLECLKYSLDEILRSKLECFMHRRWKKWNFSMRNHYILFLLSDL